MQRILNTAQIKCLALARSVKQNRTWQGRRDAGGGLPVNNLEGENGIS